MAQSQAISITALRRQVRTNIKQTLGKRWNLRVLWANKTSVHMVELQDEEKINFVSWESCNHGFSCNVRMMMKMVPTIDTSLCQKIPGKSSISQGEGTLENLPRFKNYYTCVFVCSWKGFWFLQVCSYWWSTVSSRCATRDIFGLLYWQKSGLDCFAHGGLKRLKSRFIIKNYIFQSQRKLYRRDTLYDNVFFIAVAASLPSPVEKICWGSILK